MKKGIELSFTYIVIFLIVLLLVIWALLWYSGLGKKTNELLGGLF